MKAERHGVLGYQLFLVSNYVGRAVNHLCVDPKRKLQIHLEAVKKKTVLDNQARSCLSGPQGCLCEGCGHCLWLYMLWYGVCL